MKKVIILILILALGFGGFKIYQKILDNKNAWKVNILEDFINIREEHTAYSNKLGEAKKGEKYKVKEIYLEDKKYVWYKIELKDGKAGWISSSRKYPYVEEINNPNKETDAEYITDYASPIIKYSEDKYYTRNIDTITYDHLNIIEDSEYEVTSKIYKESCPSYHQYWIIYSVVDKYDNKASKTQAIVFEEEPSDDRVLNLTDIRSTICESQQ
ncbi:MAG: SH3 domain-containing protein [Bacilli bacterium]|nr:SH3 domain-containing protein [Bacilli bacterium]